MFTGYRAQSVRRDECFQLSAEPHDHCCRASRAAGQLGPRRVQQRRASADLVFVTQGITFSVYSDRRGVEKIFPFDLIPRPVANEEWEHLQAGLLQRIHALNLFLHDVYHDQCILREGIVPTELVLKSKGYRPEMVGFDPPGGQYLHVVGTDLVPPRPVCAGGHGWSPGSRASRIAW